MTMGEKVSGMELTGRTSSKHVFVLSLISAQFAQPQYFGCSSSTISTK